MEHAGVTNTSAVRAKARMDTSCSKDSRQRSRGFTEEPHREPRQVRGLAAAFPVVELDAYHSVGPEGGCLPAHLLERGLVAPDLFMHIDHADDLCGTVETLRLENEHIGAGGL